MMTKESSALEKRIVEEEIVEPFTEKENRTMVDIQGVSKVLRLQASRPYVFSWRRMNIFAFEFDVFLGLPGSVTCGNEPLKNFRRFFFFFLISEEDILDS